MTTSAVERGAGGAQAPWAVQGTVEVFRLGAAAGWRRKASRGGAAWWTRRGLQPAAEKQSEQKIHAYIHTYMHACIHTYIS